MSGMLVSVLSRDWKLGGVYCFISAIGETYIPLLEFYFIFIISLHRYSLSHKTQSKTYISDESYQIPSFFSSCEKDPQSITLISPQGDYYKVSIQEELYHHSEEALHCDRVWVRGLHYSSCDQDPQYHSGTFWIEWRCVFFFYKRSDIVPISCLTRTQAKFQLSPYILHCKAVSHPLFR